MKMTKLSFSTAILFAAFLFVFNACKKDDDPVDPGTPGYRGNQIRHSNS
jgi:hypothetical protein